MTQSELEALLGRPLTTAEVTNLSLYLEIAQETLEGLLCVGLEKQAENATAEDRVFESRDGYSTVFTGIFTEVTEVKVDGQIVDPSEYHRAQWNSRNGTWFNSIVFKDKLCGEDVAVTAKWGFTTIPADLRRLLAQLFVKAGRKYVAAKVQSKQTEDFRITFGTDMSEDELFASNNRVTIAKYSLCTISNIRHGKVRYGHRSI